MLPSILYLIFRLLLGLARCRDGGAVEIENAVLRHQLTVLRRHVARPRYHRRDRLFLAAASTLLSRDRWSAFLVTPQTLLRWHRELVRRKWTLRRTRKPDAETIAPAVGLRHGDPGLKRYLVVLRGDFTGYWAKVPPGADLPTGDVLAFAVDPTTREVTDSSIGDRDVRVAGLMPFTLPDASHTHTDPDGWSVIVPPGWKTGLVLNPSTGDVVGSFIASTFVDILPAGDQTLAQAGAHGFPAGGVALVIAPADRVLGMATVLTPPLSIGEFNAGSGGGGTTSTLDTAWFEGNGRLFGATIRIGPDASAVDLDAIGKVVASLSFVPVSPSAASTTRCTQATTSGDFDGDGATDEADFIEVVSGSASCDRPGQVVQNLSSQELVIRFGSGQTLQRPFTDCHGGVCAYVFEAVDLDGGGRQVLVVDVSGSGDASLLEFYRVDADGIHPITIAEPGDPPYVESGPAILGGGFNSVLQSPIICRVNENGTRELVSIHAEDVGDSLSGPWRVHSTTMILEGDRLVVTSTHDSKSSFPDTTGIPSFAKTSPFENGCA